MRFNSLTALFLSTLTALAADTCTINSGIAGQCISTSSCSGQGGKSEAGHCPGATDIQCCTYPSCSAGGVKGQCQPTGSCGGTKTPGLCPGPTDIQCCTSAAGGGGGGGSGGGADGSCSAPPVNQATVDLIKEFEGFVASPAPDPIGLPTVGYGHLCKSKGCAEVTFKFPLTKSTAAQLLQQDLKSYEKCISADIKDSIKLNDNQYGALVSWTFNVGCGNVGSSSLVKRLNAGESPNKVAAEELIKWNKAGGRVLSGLTRRRNAEIALFKTASSKAALPPC